MGRKKRPFIDRSLARTYELVYRPREDTREGPERVLRLVETSAARRHRRHGGDGEELSTPTLTRDDPLGYKPENSGEGVENIEEWDKSYNPAEYELGEYGFKDGGYDYSKHFKNIGHDGGVFLAVNEEEAGEDKLETEEMKIIKKEDEESKRQALEELAKDRKRCKDLDVVLEALDSDGEFEIDENSGETVRSNGSDVENASVADGEIAALLEDDFVNAAGGDVVDLAQSAHTEGRRQRLLDEQFDKLLEVGYAVESDSELEEFGESGTENNLTKGAFLVDGLVAKKSVNEIERTDRDNGIDNVKGTTDLNEEIDGIVEKFLQGHQALQISEVFNNPENIAGARAAMERAEDVAQDSSDDLDKDEDERERWDCETILTTYSNLSNHPSVIDDRRPRKRKRNLLGEQSELPRKSLPTSGPDANIIQIDRSASVSTRTRGESKEERKIRKREVKALARQRRQQKTELRKAFRTELVKQECHAAGMGTTKVAVRL
eukprot:Plantae.Rhodophyta-Hildenbrandia_rubra.ctg8198.p3 GENE.Plantae.Rhodophyta-Hildenbrandia_rubra.ctg8198~~Plantae.Rhodophyta-Hildenbrandia_rubra.ctg8198.p3  ORF type:complete len:492 (+),score=106.72 Plantae.Rhodophyta-Hildenbrandia_rubra.ctg8198:697-2172(+)